ncbi:MAG: hypothetical protein LBJ14_08285 [Desulfarculales bacterium]|jgi:hypothetical protein|nr:hypothetical protein [Desulfarculales bacterium]
MDLDGLVYDFRLGYVRAGRQGGFAVLGADRAPDRRIVTLGGTEGWASRLYERFGRKRQIYDGSTEGYTSAQELTMLLRDGLLLNPEMVLCYSCFYNFAYKLGFVGDKRYAPLLGDRPFTTPGQIAFYEKITARFGLGNNRVYYGEKNAVPAWEYWIEQQSRIHCLCQEFGIRHLAFLQPCAFSGEYQRSAEENEKLRRLYDVTPEELSAFAALFQKQYAAASQAARDCGYIFDLAGLFDGESGVYKDACRIGAAGLDRIVDAILPCLGSATQNEA